MSGTNWQPEQQGLQEIIQVLISAKQGDNKTQFEVQKKLNEFRKFPEFPKYLMFITTQLNSLPSMGTPESLESLRAMAGLLLKNHIKGVNEVNGMTPSAVSYVKEQCLLSLGDELPLVRSTVGSIITSLISKIGIIQWSNVFTALLQLIDSNNYNAIEGGLSALQKILEDSGSQFSKTVKTDQSIHSASGALVQVLLRLLSQQESQRPRVRIYALQCYNLLISFEIPAAFEKLPQEYLPCLFKLASDEVGEVRALVCKAFVTILDTSPEILIPHLISIGDFMIFSMTNDQNDQVSLEACEFWLEFAERNELKDYLKPILPKLIPVLLKGMVYSEYDISVLGGDEENEDVPDRDEDMKPRHLKNKSHSLERREDGEVEDDEEEDEDDEIYSEWNLRKCSAATLDLLASNYGNIILPILLPLLNDNLTHKEWKYRESGVLALGAISEGCMSGLMSHLSQLIPFLFQCLHEANPLVRSITCWTLGRYCAWCIDPNVNSDGPSITTDYLTPLIGGLLERILDKNKRVQEAACSAFATLEEEACEFLVPYLENILTVLTTAFTKYQSKNLMILYDAIGTLAENVNSSLNSPRYVSILMPPLIEKWNHLPDGDSGLLPLLECLSCVATALGSGFEPFAKPVHDRCIRLIQCTLEAEMRYHQNPSMSELPDKDFMIVSLDLLSGIVQGLGSSVDQILSNQNPPFFELLGFCLKDTSAEVRQSAFALVGDLSIASFHLLAPYLPSFLPVILKHMDHSFEANVSACNNATWAAGEIGLRYGKEIGQFVPPMINSLIPLLNHQEVPRTLHENAAITLGRLGLAVPELIAPRLDHFALNWCKVLRSTKDNQEKESAFRGFCKLLELNPRGIGSSFVLFCEAIINWNNPNEDLQKLFGGVLMGYKGMMGPEEWATFCSSLPANSKEKMSRLYQIAA